MFRLKIKHSFVDNWLAFAVAIQSPLIILQQILADILGMEVESTTIYRVMLTAVPMVIAIVLGFNRNKRLFLVTYIFSVLLLFYTIVVFPQNYEYIVSEAIRFTLPVIIPSCLCLICLSDIHIFEKVLYYISWLTFYMAVYYVLNIILGIVPFSGYNMSFSYGLLLPMVSLYSHRNKYSVLASFLLFIFVVAIGSRGAAVVFALYIFMDIVLFNKKYIPLIALLVLGIIVSIPIFLNYLDELGVSSRTLMLLLSGEINQDSGRSEVYELVLTPLLQNPILGLGLWGDRYYIDGFYCHNIILEILLNFGLIIGPLIIIVFVYKFIVTYIRSSSASKQILLKYFISCILPLFLSNSYLIAPIFGISMGIFYAIKVQSHKKYRSIIK